MSAAWVLGCLAGLILGWRAREWWVDRHAAVTRARERAARQRYEQAADAMGRRRGRVFDIPPADMQRQMLSYAACCGVLVVTIAPKPAPEQA